MSFIINKKIWNIENKYITDEKIFNSRRKILKNLALVDVDNLQKLRYITPEQLSELDDVNRRMREIRKEATRLGGLAEDAGPKNKALERLQTQFNALQSSKNEILGAKQRKIKQDEKNITEKLQEEGKTVKNLNFEYHLGLYDLYESVARMGLPKDGQYIKLDMSSQEAAVDQLYELGYDRREGSEIYLNLLDANATVDGNNIIINETQIYNGISQSITNAEGAYAALAPLEELFHLNNKGLKIVDKNGNLKEQYVDAVNQTIEKLKEGDETLLHQLKLIEGKFTKREALNILNSVVDVKINFHKLQRLSRIEGNVQDTCVFDNSRIKELISDKSNAKEFLNSLELGGRALKITSTIHISIED